MTNDAAMLEHAIKWRHWNGGPDEDIFVEFGISAPQYFQRIRRILTGSGRAAVDAAVVAELMDVCNRRVLPPMARAG
jgi:hypothetical protein